MSLTDALLLEGYRDPREVWIALRTDGVKGSGTASDPYDATTEAFSSVSIASLGKSGTTATALTTGPHGFVSGDLVTLSGVKRTKVPANQFDADINYVGTFQVTATDSTHFTYTMPGEPASAQAVASPGGITAWRERERFDAIMRTIPPNTQIHLGPGVFETKGSGPVPGGIPGKPGSWHIQAGQHLRGSGIDVTVLKLVNASFAENHWSAISHYVYDTPNHCEVSDLTIDCNISGQPDRQVACGAIALGAHHVRIRRIRAINFGSQSASYVENFVVVLNAIHPNTGILQTYDGAIEDCIAERTCANAVNNSTIFHLGGGESGSGIHGYYVGFAIRNCYVDGRIVYGSQVPVPIQSISFASGVVSVTTKAPHLLTSPGNVIVSGVTVNGNPANLFNGVFEVDQIVSATDFKYKLNTAATPDAGSGSVGGGVSSHRVSVIGITPDDALEVCPELALHPFEVYEWPRTNKITTHDPHYRTRNNNVRIYGVYKRDPADPTKFIPSTAFDGSFAVDEYDPAKPNELVFTLLQDPDFDVSKPGEILLSPAFANVGHQALSAGGGIGTVVEGNRVYHCSTGGPYHDTFSTGDTTARNNYYHDVLSGPTEALAGGISSNFNPISLASLTRKQDQHDIAIATTALPHGFRVNDRVIISNVTGNDAAFYNGNVVITSVPSATEFRYQMSNEAGADAPSGAGYGTYEEVAVPGGTAIVSYQTRLTALQRIQSGSRYFGRATTTLFQHGLVVGDAVRIRKAGAFQNGGVPPPGFPDSDLPNTYNGVFRVTKIVDAQTFEYEFIDANGNSYDPGVPGSSFSAGYFGRLWQVKRTVIENNVIELAVRYFSGYGNSTAIPFYVGRPFPPEYTAREVIIRGNVIRNVNDGFAPDNRGMDLNGCESLLIQDNIVISDLTTPLRHNVVGIVKTFNNLSPDGKLIRSTNAAAPYNSAPEVVTQVQSDFDDATIASFLNI